MCLWQPNVKTVNVLLDYFKPIQEENIKQYDKKYYR